MKFFEKEIRVIVVLTLFSACLFLVGLGKMPLTDPDEVFYAQTAREMLDRDEWVTPYIFGEPQFEKPPLSYWLTILSYKAFGVNEFGARFPFALLGLIGVLGIYLFGKITVNRRTGFLSAVILATGVKYLALARAAVTDMALTVCILYAFLFFFYGYLAEQGKKKWYLLTSLCLGLAVLTKGPVGVVLPVAIVGIFLIVTKDLKRLKEFPFFSGIFLFLAVSLPWYLLAYKAHGPLLLGEFFGFHNIVRFLHPEHKIGDVFYYYVPVVIAGFAPWTVFLLSGVWQFLVDKKAEVRKIGVFLASWILVIFIFFSASRTKLPTYVFPFYPALAVLVGCAWDRFLAGGLSEKANKLFRFSMYLFFGIIAGGMIALCVLAKIDYPSILNATIIVAACFTMLTAFSVKEALSGRCKRAISVFMISFCAVVFPISYIILPEIGRYEASKEISEKALTLIKPDEVFGAETDYRRGVAFYTGRIDVPDVHPHHVVTKLLEAKKRAFCVLKEKNHIQLYTNKEAPYNVPTYVLYKLGKKVLVTNNVPPGAEVLKTRSMNEPY